MWFCKKKQSAPNKSLLDNLLAGSQAVPFKDYREPSFDPLKTKNPLPYLFHLTSGGNVEAILRTKTLIHGAGSPVSFAGIVDECLAQVPEDRHRVFLICEWPGQQEYATPFTHSSPFVPDTALHWFNANDKYVETFIAESNAFKIQLLAVALINDNGQVPPSAQKLVNPVALSIRQKLASE